LRVRSAFLGSLFDKQLISENLEVLEKIADYLYEKETITGAQFMEIFNDIKGIKPEENKDKSEE